MPVFSTLVLFFFLWLDDFKWIIFEFTGSFFGLIKSAAVPVAVFNFLHCSLQHQSFCFMISAFLLNILLVYYVPDFIGLSICVLVGCWAFLKQVFWILCQATLRGQPLESYCGVMCPWFSCSLECCVAVFAFEKQSPPPALVTDWLWVRNTFNSQPCWAFQGFLRPFLWMHPLHTSYALLGWILKMVYLLSTPQSQPRCWEPPICFPRMVPWDAQVHVLSPNLPASGWLSAHAHCLSTEACTYHLHVQGASFGRGRVTWVNCTEHWTAPMVQLGALQIKCTQQLVSRPPPAECLVGPTYLWWVPGPGCCAASLSQTLAMCHTAGGTRHPLTALSLSPWEKLWARWVSLGTELCRLSGGMMWAKQNSSLHLR